MSNLPYRQCSVESCNRKHDSKGFCYMHYRRFKNTGTTEPRKPRLFEERFWEKVNKNGSVHPVLGTKCWVWTAGRSPLGYGQLNLVTSKGKRPVLAHRFSWETHKGKVPEGLCVLHACDNPPCVNPEHLFLGSRKDNTQDMIRKGRNKPIIDAHPRGEKHGSAKLTEADVREARLLYAEGGVSSAFLAKKYDLSPGHMRRILGCRSWRHVD